MKAADKNWLVSYISGKEENQSCMLLIVSRIQGLRRFTTLRISFSSLKTNQKRLKTIFFR